MSVAGCVGMCGGVWGWMCLCVGVYACVHARACNLACMHADRACVQCWSSGLLRSTPHPTVLHVPTPPHIPVFLAPTPPHIRHTSGRWDKEALRLVHMPSCTVFSNWPTSKTPLSYVFSLDFSPSGGYLAVGNDKGKVLLYRLKHYSEV